MQYSRKVYNRMTRSNKIGCHENIGTRISPENDLPQQKLANLFSTLGACPAPCKEIMCRTWARPMPMPPNSSRGQNAIYLRIIKETHRLANHSSESLSRE